MLTLEEAMKKFLDLAEELEEAIDNAPGPLTEPDKSKALDADNDMNDVADDALSGNTTPQLPSASAAPTPGGLDLPGMGSLFVSDGQSMLADARAGTNLDDITAKLKRYQNIRPDMRDLIANGP